MKKINIFLFFFGRFKKTTLFFFFIFLKKHPFLVQNKTTKKNKNRMATSNLSSTFWLRCVPARLVLAVAIYYLPVRWLPFAGLVSLVGAAGLTYRAVTFSPTQRGAFHQPVTWNVARPFHAVGWLMFAVLAFGQNPNAKIIPFLDLAFGVFAHSLLS